MSAIVVCLDCPNYRNGGWCRLKNKDTGALTPACADASKTKEEVLEESNKVIKEEPMETTNTTTKTCKKCGRTLTLDHFYTNKGKPNSICKECKREEVKRYKKPKEAKAPRKTAEQPVRETLTDKQMVDLLREHGWTVTCEKYEKVEL